MAKKEEEMKISIGAVITEPGSTLRCKTGAWRVFRPKLIKEKCIKCYKCWQSCPDNAIKINEKGEISIDYDYCKGCMICVKECPAKAIEREAERK
jgi:pyruvate ferredoxin oxidoreductase delta subunit